jgi:hypothetical protein
MDSNISTDKNTEPRYPRHILEIIREAFNFAPGESYHTLFLFPVLEQDESKWGFLIVTRRAGDGRLELAAYSYEIDEQGNLSKKLESRKARLPEDKLDEVLDGLILRMDELDSDFREVDLQGLGDCQAQLEYLEKLLLGEPDGGQTASPEHMQPRESSEYEPQSGDCGSEQ